MMKNVLIIDGQKDALQIFRPILIALKIRSVSILI